MGNSVYQQTKHKQWSGFQRAPRASKCFNCGGLGTQEQVFKGWCASCLAKWGASADAALIAAARESYTAHGVLKEPPTALAYERLKARIAERLPDEWFVPLTLFVGNYTVGRAQAMWNFIQAMYELELETTVQVFHLGKKSHDAIHMCGLHAPVQNSTLGSFLSRLQHSEKAWASIDARLKEYLRGFINDNRHLGPWLSPRLRIPAVTTGPNHKCKRPYRLNTTQKSRAAAAEWREKYSVVIQPTPEFWPFAVRQAPAEHEMLHQIDRLTRGIPEQWRQDVCQDLVVAVLLGETSVSNLRDALRENIRRVFTMHPIKYGHASLDAPVYWSEDASRSLGDILAAIEQEDREDEAPTDASLEVGGWHEGFDRPVGLTRMGELLRHKHGDRAF